MNRAERHIESYSVSGEACPVLVAALVEPVLMLRMTNTVCIFVVNLDDFRVNNENPLVIIVTDCTNKYYNKKKNFDVEEY